MACNAVTSPEDVAESDDEWPGQVDVGCLDGRRSMVFVVLDVVEKKLTSKETTGQVLSPFLIEDSRAGLTFSCQSPSEWPLGSKVGTSKVLGRPYLAQMGKLAMSVDKSHRKGSSLV